MATVHLGRLLGSAGFTRTVAIKRLHAQYARDPEFVSMFLDEARLAARIRHPNVVPTLDVVAKDGELFLVMEYVHGETLARVLAILREKGELPPPAIVAAIVAGMLHGLHAAHEAKSEGGRPLGIIHRDVSPQNVLIGTDGTARVVDFGVAKAAGRLQTTQNGGVKGKLAYMAPEQLTGAPLTRQADVFGAGVVLWEALTGRRLFRGANEGETVARVLNDVVLPPSRHVRSLDQRVDAITLQALERDPSRRWQTAREMALALEQSVSLATASEVGEWVAHTCQDGLARRLGEIEAVESSEVRPAQRSDSGAPPTLAATTTESASPPAIAAPLAGEESSSRAGSFSGQLRRSRYGAHWPLLAASLLVLAAVAFFTAQRGGTEAVVGNEARTPAPALRLAASSLPVSVKQAPETPSSTPPVNESAVAAAAPSASQPVAAPAGARPLPKHAVARPAPAKNTCAQPYYVDAQGVRRVRRECFH